MLDFVFGPNGSFYAKAYGRTFTHNLPPSLQDLLDRPGQADLICSVGLGEGSAWFAACVNAETGKMGIFFNHLPEKLYNWLHAKDDDSTLHGQRHWPTTRVFFRPENKFFAYDRNGYCADQMPHRLVKFLDREVEQTGQCSPVMLGLGTHALFFVVGANGYGEWYMPSKHPKLKAWANPEFAKESGSSKYYLEGKVKHFVIDPFNTPAQVIIEDQSKWIYDIPILAGDVAASKVLEEMNQHIRACQATKPRQVQKQGDPGIARGPSRKAQQRSGHDIQPVQRVELDSIDTIKKTKSKEMLQPRLGVEVRDSNQALQRLPQTSPRTSNDSKFSPVSPIKRYAVTSAAHVLQVSNQVDGTSPVLHPTVDSSVLLDVPESKHKRQASLENARQVFEQASKAVVDDADSVSIHSNPKQALERLSPRIGTDSSPDQVNPPIIQVSQAQNYSLEAIHKQLDQLKAQTEELTKIAKQLEQAQARDKQPTPVQQPARGFIPRPDGTSTTASDNTVLPYPSPSTFSGTAIPFFRNQADRAIPQTTTRTSPKSNNLNPFGPPPPASAYESTNPNNPFRTTSTKQTANGVPLTNPLTAFSYPPIMTSPTQRRTLFLRRMGNMYGHHGTASTQQQYDLSQIYALYGPTGPLISNLTGSPPHVAIQTIAAQTGFNLSTVLALFADENPLDLWPNLADMWRELERAMEQAYRVQAGFPTHGLDQLALTGGCLVM